MCECEACLAGIPLCLLCWNSLNDLPYVSISRNKFYPGASHIIDTILEELCKEEMNASVTLCFISLFYNTQLCLMH